MHARVNASNDKSIMKMTNQGGVQPSETIEGVKTPKANGGRPYRYENINDQMAKNWRQGDNVNEPQAGWRQSNDGDGMKHSGGAYGSLSKRAAGMAGMVAKSGGVASAGSSGHGW